MLANNIIQTAGVSRKVQQLLAKLPGVPACHQALSANQSQDYERTRRQPDIIMYLLMYTLRR